jgi:hypothetical protein
MFSKLLAPWPGLLILLIAPAVPGQTSAPTSSQPPTLKKLAGDDEKRAKQLDEQIGQAMNEDRWKDAVAKAEELVALRARVQGPKHFETVDAECPGAEALRDGGRRVASQDVAARGPDAA